MAAAETAASVLVESPHATNLAAGQVPLALGKSAKGTCIAVVDVKGDPSVEGDAQARLPGFVLSPNAGRLGVALVTTEPRVGLMVLVVQPKAGKALRCE
jgi:hypothetical protein